MATQTVVSQDVEFLRLVEEIESFYLSNPTNELKTSIFLTREGGIEPVRSETEDGNDVYGQAEMKLGSPVWLVVTLDKDSFDGADSGDLAEACQQREYYFASRT
jgi:hypothetical protein